jgi:hypothetical protein
MDIQLSHDRLTSYGRIYLGIGYRRLDDDASGSTSNDVEAFLRWSTQ